MSFPLEVRELSARGRGAVSVLELVGPGTIACLRRLAPGARLETGCFEVIALRDATGALLDEALVVVDSALRAELHLHGSPALVRRVRAEIGVPPSAQSWPHSIEALAEARLAEAASEAAARLLLDQAQGALRGELVALLEREGEAFRTCAAELARRGLGASWLLSPPQIVLAGPVNAGKSTLFNLLVGRERVVVDSAAGTTRDAVRERVQLGAYAVDLCDTAGERALGGEATAEVERSGQELALELRGRADLVLWLAPPGSEPPPVADPRRRVFASRADLRRVSALVPWPLLAPLEEPERTRRAVEEALLDVLELPREPWCSGQGVPFEEPWIRILERGDERAARLAVRDWLDAR
ncbi:MAG: GTP-binding protein [Planctomycetes bacterium]|nr:GTP-binding protein [Planctomycetota bacterium]